MKRSKLFLSATIFGVALAGALLAQDAATRDTVLAKVGKEKITLGHVIAFKSRLPEEYLTLEDKVLLQALVEQLVQQSLLAQTVDTNDVALKFAIENEERALLATEAINAIYAKATTEEKLKAAYHAKYASENPIQEYHAAHILVKTEAEAKELVNSLEEAADFSKLAMEKSTGPSAPKGGDLGWFTPERMVPEFSAAVIDLELEQISAPVKSDFGWHVIKLLGQRNFNAPPLEEMREELENELEIAAVEKVLAELGTKFEVVSSYSEIDPALIRAEELITTE